MLEKANYRHLLLRLLGRWKSIIAGVLAGIVLFIGCYVLMVVVLPGERDYKAELTFQINFSDSNYVEMGAYYNSYAWGQQISADPIQDVVMNSLPERFTRDEVTKALSATCKADVRILSITVVTKSAEDTTLIAEAVTESMSQFGTHRPEFDSIELIQYDQAAQAPYDLHWIKAICGGAVLGLLITLAILIIQYLVEDGIYTTEDCYRRLGVKSLGILDYAGRPFQQSEWESNVQELTGENITILYADGMPDLTQKLFYTEENPERTVRNLAYQTLTPEDFTGLKNQNNILLAFQWGRKNGKRLDHILDELELKGIKITYAIICGGKYPYLKKYYS